MRFSQEPERAAIFDAIAPGYDHSSWLLSCGGFAAWHRVAAMALDVHPQDRILDVGCGTGSITRRLARQAGAAGSVVGLDSSPGMLAVARRRSTGLPLSVQWVQGDGQRLPFPAESFDKVTAQFSLRNMEDWHRGIRELVRVTRPGSTIVLLDVVVPVTPYGRLARWGLDTATRLAPGRLHAPYRWLRQSLARFTTRQELASLLEAAGARRVDPGREWLGGLVALIRAVR